MKYLGVKMTIDEKDLELLRELEKNCKQSLKKISKKTGMSITTVYERMKRLEKNGIIRGYQALIDYEKIGFNLPTIIELVVKRENQFEVAQKLIKFKNVSSIYGVTGSTDLMIIGKFKDRGELTGFINTLFEFEGIIRTETRVILNVFEKNLVLT
ncbi:MAG: Lrp/AsnC family transcriptional regulator [Candidatus Aenigmarchaeota archaeon]|nr:Lrp/AsnC family transcriptional regulator [Candidatus Aenigmarchaeota archaeon]